MQYPKESSVLVRDAAGEVIGIVGVYRLEKRLTKSYAARFDGMCGNPYFREKSPYVAAFTDGPLGIEPFAAERDESDLLESVREYMALRYEHGDLEPSTEELIVFHMTPKGDVDRRYAPYTIHEYLFTDPFVKEVMNR